MATNRWKSADRGQCVAPSMDVPAAHLLQLRFGIRVEYTSSILYTGIPAPVSTNTCCWWLPYFVHRFKRILARIWTHQTVPHAHSMTTGGVTLQLGNTKTKTSFPKNASWKMNQGLTIKPEGLFGGIFCKYLKQPKRALPASLGLRHFFFYFLRHSLINIFWQLSIIFLDIMCLGGREMCILC